MSTHRLEKINELIRLELGKIFLSEEEFGQGVLVTILKVDTAEDLKTASVYLSIFPENKREPVMKKLNSDLSELWYQLMKKLNMHPVPKMRFILNTDEDEGQKIEGIIQDMKEKEE